MKNAVIWDNITESENGGQKVDSLSITKTFETYLKRIKFQLVLAQYVRYDLVWVSAIIFRCSAG